MSTIDSIFGPIGFVQPVVIEGNILLHEMLPITKKTEWDDPLPEAQHDEWVSWIQPLTSLEGLQIPRMYSDMSFENTNRRKVFAGASKEAIAASVYLKLYDVNRSTISFLMGKAKVAPSHGHSIPRLELCAAVLPIEIAETIADQLNIQKDDFSFFTDSQVVLGYISNECRRLYINVGNRVNRIRLCSKPSQWHYVVSEHNPADVTTRGLHASNVSGSLWLNSPEDTVDIVSESGHSVVNPDQAIEIRPEVTCSMHAVEVKDFPKPKVPFSDIFFRFSSWNKAVVLLVSSFGLVNIAWMDINTRFDDPEQLRNSELAIIVFVHREIFAEEISFIKDGNKIPRSSPLKSLLPIITNGVLRIGGRLNNALDTGITEHLCNPGVLPKNHHVTHLVVRQYHQEGYHQVQYLTEGAVRSALHWVVGMKG